LTRSMKRVAAVAVAAVAVLGTVVEPPAAAVAAAPPKELARKLGDLWTTVLELPTRENPYTSGNYCIELGRNRSGRPVVAPFAPFGVESFTCEVPPGTKVFVTAYTSECSTIEEPPYFGSDEAELRSCARAADAGITLTELTVDRIPVALAEIETGLLTVTLPKRNIFGLPPDTTAESVGHGWVAALRPLSRGAHVITVHAEGTDVFGEPVDFTTTTTIMVRPRR
jgi:hypothetical protein